MRRPSRLLPRCLAVAAVTVTSLHLGCGWFIPVSRGAKVAPKTVHELTPGTSTREDVRALFGETGSTNGNAWSYERQEAWLGVFSTQQAKMTFDADGVLQRSEYQKMGGTIFPLAMGKRRARAKVTGFSPGRDTLDDVVEALGEPNMIEKSLGERSVAYVYVSGNRTTSAIFRASREGTLTSLVHIDVPYRVSLFSGEISMGPKLLPEDVLALAPGRTPWEEMVKRLGEPSVLFVGPTSRLWVYMSVPSVHHEEAAEAEQSWLLVRAEEGGELSHIVWWSGLTYPNKYSPQFAMEAREFFAQKGAKQRECLERLGVPSGVVRDPETDRWVYVENWRGRLSSHILNFSPQGELLDHQTQEDLNWAAEAAKKFLPEEIDLSGAASLPSR